MLRIISMLLASSAGLFVADKALNLSLLETSVAIILILGFLIIATGRTLRRNVD